jgi:hypothetical protein
MDVCLCFCVVLSWIGRGLGAGLIPRPRSPTKCLKVSISKKKKSDALKRHKEKWERRRRIIIFTCVAVTLWHILPHWWNVPNKNNDMIKFLWSEGVITWDITYKWQYSMATSVLAMEILRIVMKEFRRVLKIRVTGGKSLQHVFWLRSILIRVPGTTEKNEHPWNST